MNAAHDHGRLGEAIHQELRAGDTALNVKKIIKLHHLQRRFDLWPGRNEENIINYSCFILRSG